MATTFYAGQKDYIQKLNELVDQVAEGGGGGGGGITEEQLADALETKQDTLESGTTIKTINGTSLLGAGNMIIVGSETVKEDSAYNIYSDISDYTSQPATEGLGTVVGFDDNGMRNNILLGQNVGKGLAKDPVWEQWGSNNIGIGVDCFFGSATSGAAGNVAIGTKAMKNALRATAQIAIGWETLRDCVDGWSNIAIGDGALQTHDTGDENTAIGGYALNSSTTGTKNTALGQRTLYNLTTGSNNVAIGAQAGWLSVSGTNYNTSNTANRLTLVGSNTGALGLSGDAYATAIGSDAVVSTVNTVVLGRTTDKTVIGATGDDGSGAALQVTGDVNITGDFKKNGVAIGGGGGSSDLVLIESKELTSIANEIIFNNFLDDAYGEYIIDFDGVWADASTGILMRFSEDNGATWLGVAGHYKYLNAQQATSATTNPTTNSGASANTIRIGANNLSTVGTLGGMSGQIRFNNLGRAGHAKRGQTETILCSGGDFYSSRGIWGYVDASDDITPVINAIRFYTDVGTTEFQIGSSFRLYGIRK